MKLLHTNVAPKALYQNCVNSSATPNTMAARAILQNCSNGSALLNITTTRAKDRTLHTTSDPLVQIKIIINTKMLLVGQIYDTPCSFYCLNDSTILNNSAPKA